MECDQVLNQVATGNSFQVQICKELRYLNYALVKRHLAYGIVVVGAALPTHLNPLEITQEKKYQIMDICHLFGFVLYYIILLQSFLILITKQLNIT